MVRVNRPKILPVVHPSPQCETQEPNPAKQEEAIKGTVKKSRKKPKPRLSPAEQDLIGFFLTARLEDAIEGLEKAKRLFELDPTLPGHDGQMSYWHAATQFCRWCLHTLNWSQDWLKDLYPEREWK